MNRQQQDTLPVGKQTGGVHFGIRVNRLETCRMTGSDGSPRQVAESVLRIDMSITRPGLSMMGGSGNEQGIWTDVTG